jgi:hypothetical protein
VRRWRRARRFNLRQNRLQSTQTMANEARNL